MTTRLLAIAAVFIALLLQMFDFVSRYAVNLLFWDQWDIYTPLFQDLDAWRIFRWEHTPHRGLGMVITSVLARVSGWNSVVDSMAVAVVLGLVTLTAIALKYRLFRSISFFDVTIPLLCLTLFQYESLVVMANVSDRALPVLMLLCFSFALLIRARLVRYGLLLVLNLSMIYTGYGMFIAPITLGVFALEAVHSRHDAQALRLVAVMMVLVVASGASYFVGYRGSHGDISFHSADLLRYPAYVSLMLATFWGWHASILGPLSMVAGVVLLAIAGWISFFHARRVLRDPAAPRVSLVIAVLSAYALTYCVFTAIGRLSLGLQYAQVSRYVTSLIPLYLAVYFHLNSLPRTTPRQFALGTFLVMAMMGSLPLGIVDRVASKTTIGKTNWKACYLRLEDAARCDQLTGFQIYPDASALAPKMEFLKQHRLNLYLDASVAP